MKTNITSLKPSQVKDTKAMEMRKLYILEFFSGTTTTFYFTDINDPSLKQILEWVSEGMEGKRMALDLEWKAFSKTRDDQKASLFQIGTNERAVIIRYVDQKSLGTQHEVLRNFLLSHKFIGKGIGCDLKKLNERFDADFSTIIYDFEFMYMRKYDKCASFARMIEIYAGTPTAMFKDKKVSTSNWNAPRLSYKQVLYSTFDVVGLYQSYVGAQIRYPDAESQYINEMKHREERKKEKKRKRNLKRKMRQQANVKIVG